MRLRPAALRGMSALAIVGISASSCTLVAGIDYDLIPDAGSGAAGGEGSACTSDAMCDDGAPCTLDQCAQGACVHSAAPAGTSCGDDDACNGAETCDESGMCVVTPVEIDDGDPCTFDACDPQTGVTHTSAGEGCLAWAPLPLEGAPAARINHSAVWTGSKMILWGGEIGGADPLTSTGALYDPASRTWKPTSTAGAPAPRHSHRAVWTGSKMLVWGGYAAGGFVGAGGIYDPETDTWAPMSTAGEPAGRGYFSAVWTGSALIVWGGIVTSPALGTGGVYDLATNTWKTVPTQSGPSPRFNHTAVWTGDRMVVWGGQDLFDWLDDGALFDPKSGGSGAWTGYTPFQDRPGFREMHSAVWTGSAMMIWGGWNGGPHLDTGGILDLAAGGTGTWTAMTTDGAPSPRREHVAAWTGSEMVVWGGCGEDLCKKIFADGGRFVPGPGGGTWKAIPAVPALGPRRGHTGVWTGDALIVWGGRNGPTLLGDGAEAKP
ncbi:hypothetical protein [Polyangium aurulentum]|uniref:Kelch repeat-containing protein n=1 Tax=Polyangium aurulentum TaxID=2567896 RepID=UPI0010AE791C|nr:hypothetical protein [Polyangium aurulentum]UQA57988.1 hypothetical protein E8A73_043085 [Polyangium aurulentum]